MRRKLFTFTCIVVIMLYFADCSGIQLSSDPFADIKNEEHDFTAKIVRISGSDEHLRLEARILTCDGIRFKTGKKIILSCYEEQERPWELYNAVISFKTVLSEPQGRRNPHCFDYGMYLRSCRIFAAGTLNSFTIMEDALSLTEKYQRWLFEKRCNFEKGLSPQVKGIITGILFGDTTYLDDDLYEIFRNNGTAHVLAVSGLHVGILYNLYKKVAGRRNNPVLLAGFAFLLFSYGTLSMWSPSTIRAEIMVVLSLTARIADLRYDMLTSMSAAALILIAANPYVIFGAGFQMSFLAIVSIAFIRPVLPKAVPEFMAVSVAVTLGLLPYQIYQFNYVSVVAPAANIPVVFLTGYFVPVALMYFVESMFSGSGCLLKPAAEGMAHLIIEINKLSSAGGHGAFEVVSPPFWMAAAAGAMIFFLCSESFWLMVSRRKHKSLIRWISGIIMCCLAAGTFVSSPQTKDEIVFVDVGQGDCIHLRDGRTDVLIDGGGNISYNMGKNVLKPYLLKNGARDIETAFVTHRHTDHYKGVEELSEVFSVKSFYSEMTAGQTVRISDNIYIETLWPEYIPPEGQEENRFCSVFMIYFRGYKILATGDLDEAGEKALTEKYRGTGKLECDILKIAHHGSAYSSCDVFLDAASPVFAVIQCGKNNYGHPSPKTIENCRKKGIIVYRNDENGAVSFCLGKNKIEPHLLIN